MWEIDKWIWTCCDRFDPVLKNAENSLPLVSFKIKVSKGNLYSVPGHNECKNEVQD